MFSLRRINLTGLSSNQIIGNEYTIARKVENPEAYQGAKSLPEWQEVDDANIYGFLITATTTIPLYIPSKYYIMSSDGKTFENISYGN